MQLARSRSRSAFTLIELLVVIAIIAILAAILFPVFATAREKARQTSCSSNQKQLTLGMLQYVQDYDETFPGTLFNNASASSVTTPWDATPTGNPGARKSFWSNAIDPYVKAFPIYTCPSASDERNDVFGVTSAQSNGITFSYTFNGYLNHYNMAGVPAPAATFMFSEGLGKATMPRFANAFPLAIDSSGAIMPEFSPGNTVQGTCGTAAGAYGFDFNYNRTWWVHSGGSNYGFIDGHVKYFKNPSQNGTWATLDDKGLPLTLWVYSATNPKNYCGTFYYWYAPTER